MDIGIGIAILENVRFRSILALLVLASATSASTLQKLTVEQMAEKSTEVVVAKASRCTPELKGKLVFTTCRLVVSERWKTASQQATTVSLPGGSAQGVTQQFAGVPSILPDTQYVFFLWTGPSGMTQIIGLSQGALSIEKTDDGVPMAVRTPARERMLGSTGKPVWDEGVDISLHQLRRTVQKAAAK